MLVIYQPRDIWEEYIIITKQFTYNENIGKFYGKKIK